jgi:carbonic anhydrase
MPTERIIIPAIEALARLRAGNQRYVQNVRSVDSMISHSRRGGLPVQSPCAIILGCSDSRAPAEIVFDQGLGDLFVIRVAGNIVAPSQVGSVEFAAERFGTRLVVVMGHTQCGAIDATIEAMSAEHGSPSPNLQSIVNRVRPGIEALMATELTRDPVRLRREAMRANVRASVGHLRHGSEVIERLAAEGGLAVVGAELDLATGEVHFFDDLGVAKAAKAARTAKAAKVARAAKAKASNGARVKNGVSAPALAARSRKSRKPRTASRPSS